ncbi:MAG: TonB-dependent receptor [Chlorobi bacterium]|nr:TonB-dependent receptor [Chlorobiota bacterium]
MYKIIQIILFSLLFSSNVFTQDIIISGYVQDKETGEKLIGANIYDIISIKGTSTNNFGFYSLSIPKTDTIKLAISFIGYQMQKKELIQTSENETINFDLKQGTVIQEVEVIAKRTIQQKTEMSIIEIPIKQIKTLPALGGEVDIMKALQLMPGVQSGNEGSSGLYVRGGSPDQNLILLDDVPLYYLNHLGGFVSVFNADAINNIKLIKGGFPAQYGSRLSSIVDIRMKDGNLKKIQGQGTVGLVSSKLSLEGPVKIDTTSYIISVRRFMLDLISRPLTKIMLDDISSGYTFYDINVKFNHKFSYKDRLYFSFYTGDDKMITKRKTTDDVEKEKIIDQLKWGNMLGALRWNHLYSQKLFSNLTLTYSRYRYLAEFSSISKSDNITTEYLNAFNSNIKDVSGKMDFDYFMNTNYKIKFGVNSIYHNFTPGIASYKHIETNTSQIDTSFNNQKFNALENAIYFENIFKAGKKFKTNIGLRASNYIINQNEGC